MHKFAVLDGLLYLIFFQGMIEGLESDIRSFFEQNPDSGSKYVLSGLTSYERLLAHACSNYNLLNSNSLDGQDGNRTLTIANPSPKFTKPEPSLTDYLKTRLEIAA